MVQALESRLTKVCKRTNGYKMGWCWLVQVEVVYPRVWIDSSNGGVVAPTCTEVGWCIFVKRNRRIFRGMKAGRPAISASGEVARMVGVKLPPHTLDRIREECDLHGVTQSEWIRRAIDAALRKQTLRRD